MAVEQLPPRIAPIESPGLFGMAKSALGLGTGEQTPAEAPTEENTTEQQKRSELMPLARKEKRVKSILDRAATPRDVTTDRQTPIEPLPSRISGMENEATKGVEVPGQHNITGTDIVNFIAGPEMSVIGMKLDNAGFSWEWENMKQQWSEEPLWSNLLATTSLVGTIAFPAARAAWVTAKYGKVGQLLPKMAVPLLGEIGGVGKGVQEVERLKALGLIEKDVVNPSEKYLRIARQQEVARSKYIDLSVQIEKNKLGELVHGGPIDRLKFEFDKRFANSYFNIANSLMEGTTWRADYIKNLDELYNSKDLGKFFVGMPGPEEGKALMQHHLWRLRPDVVPEPKLSPTNRLWADTLYERRAARQAEMLDDGFIDAATYKHVGEAHVPALYKDTPQPDMDFTRTRLLPIRGGKVLTKQAPPMVTEVSGLGRLLGTGVKYEAEAEEGTKYIALRTTKYPRLDSDTLKMRKADIPEVYQRLLEDKLITDPADIYVRGDITSELIHNNFKTVRDIMMDPRYAVNDFDIMAKYGSVEKAGKAGYINFDNVGTGIGNRLRRMLDAKGVTLENDKLPWIRKSIFDEIFGESGMFAQSMFGADMLELATTIHKTSKTGLSVPTHFQNLLGNFAMLMQAGFNPLSPEHVNIQYSMAKAFNKIAEIHETAKAAGYSTRSILDNIKVDLGKIAINGKSFNLNEELLHPMVRELIEESAFETTEGLSHVQNLMGRLKEGQYFTRGAAKLFLGTKKFLQAGDRIKWFDKMTKWYLGEDMVPKMAYYMKLRAEGLTREASVLEVGRRLPMYATVGSGVKFSRKFLFPWASFPAEALRITKNNLMDNPLRMIPWLHMPQIMQSMLSAVDPEVGSPELVDETKRQLPIYGQKPTTVVSTTNTAENLGSVSTGAALGGIAGGLRGGAMGALTGAVLGGLGGYAAKEASKYIRGDSKGDVLRGSIINWLPHSSFFLTTNSPDYTLSGGPFETLQQLQEQLPAEPLAILKPLLEIAAGKTDFGADVGAESFGDQVGKALSGFIGFLAPPWVQKYGFKTTTPDVALSESILGKAIPGDITNVSRFLTDTGTTADPSTGRRGNLRLDFLLNNFGAWKSYTADPKIQLANEVSTDNNMENIRTYHAKNLDYHLQNGEDDKVMDILTKVQSTFARQYADNPRRAASKYGDWLERYTKSFGKHPKLRHWSEDELRERLRTAKNFSGEERGKARDALIKTIRDELIIRKISQATKENSDRENSRISGSENREKRGLG